VAAIAAVAHSRKSLGGGLPERQEILAWEGVTDPLWYEVSKSRRAPKYARRATAKGSRLSPRRARTTGGSSWGW
jgi:diacylglycerol kinase (ATP)